MNLGRWARVLRLAVRRTATGKGRAALLVAIVAVSVLIFTFVQALAAASTRDLDDAIAEDLGVEGRYEVTIPLDLGVPLDEVARVGAELALSEQADASLLLVDHGSQPVACATLDGSDAEDQVLVLLDAVHAASMGVHPTTDAVPDPPCLAGVAVPASGLEDLDLRAALLLDEPPVLLDRAMADDADAALGPPERLVVLLRLEAPDDRTAALVQGLASALAEPAARAGAAAGWQDRVTVSRLDGGASIRDAGRGVALVYRLLGWGVLLLGGSAVLVAQLVDGPTRRRAFGLARVLGARPADLVLLVIAEVGVVVASGLVVAVGIAGALRPALSRWSIATFDAELRLLDVGTVLPLLVAVLVLVLLGASLPAWRAARTDPLVALEP